MAGSDKQPYANVQAAAFQFWAAPVLQDAKGVYYVPGFEGSVFAKSPWDYIQIAVTYGPTIGGARPDKTPGVCRVRIKKEYSVDKKKPAGGSGARVTFHGIDAAEFDIEVKIWTPEQLHQLQLLWGELFPPANKGSPIAFDVQHPVLSLHGVKALQFMSGEGPDVQPDRTAVFRIRAIEFLKPITGKSAVKTDEKPRGNAWTPNASKPSDNTANLGPK